MMLILYLFMIIFKFYSPYDIIPITNFEIKFVTFESSENFAIFSYFIPGSSNLTNYYHKIS